MASRRASGSDGMKKKQGHQHHPSGLPRLVLPTRWPPNPPHARLHDFKYPATASHPQAPTKRAASPSSAALAPRPQHRLVVVQAEAAVGTGGGINPAIRKEDKVVDIILNGELAKPLTAYCRCWRSGTFPLCDGGHAKHNKATGDNVGPLLVKK